MLKCTVTDLHLCQHCPRLFAYSWVKKKNAAFIGHRGTGNLPGTLFHTFAHMVLQDISSKGAGRQALVHALSQNPHAISFHIHETIKEEYLIPFLAEHGSTLTIEKIEAFATACERWIKYLEKFINPHISSFQDLDILFESIFHNTEYLMTSSYVFDDGESMSISGKPDALIFDPKTKEPVVLEYKGRKESDAMQDLAQTSLYAWLVRQSIGIIPRVDILYLEENMPLVRYPLPAIENLIENHPSLFQIARKIMVGETRIPKCSDNALCQVCPFIPSCDNDFGEMIPAVIHTDKIVPQEKEHTPQQDAEELLSTLTEKLNLLSIPVIPSGYTIGPRFIRLKIIPDIRKKVTFAKIVNRTVDIQLGLSLLIPPLIQAQGGYISCDVQRNDWESFDVRSLVQDGGIQTKHTCPYPLGRRIDGSVFVGDLADPNMTSCLIGGTSGSGKSELIRSMVVGIALHNRQTMLSFTLIDPKRVTFTDFFSFPYLSQPVIMDPNTAMNILNACVHEMEERYKVLEKSGYSNISEYNGKENIQMVRRIIVIDEYADLIMNKATKEALENAIQKIGQKGRAAGFHLILATQRPDAKIVTGVIKANLQLKIALKVTSSTNSRIILDETGAECLAGYGDMLIGGSVPIQRLQSSKVSERDLKALYGQLDQ